MGMLYFRMTLKIDCQPILKVPCLNFVMGRGCESILLAEDKSNLLFFKVAVAEVERVLAFADS